MTAATFAIVLGVLTFALGIPSVGVLVFRSIRNPLREQLVDMTKDRDHYRDKCERLEAELRQRRQ